MTTSEYQVNGMSCEHCEAAVRSEVAQIPGVEGVDVSARTGRLVVTSSGPVDASAVLDAIDAAGYQATLVA
ncbi:MAG: heavy metal-associated domain-containing protein [Mycobacterium sp.]|nr:heavy metal-associated domain-containing protein [Mycobacterium sp.]